MSVREPEDNQRHRPTYTEDDVDETQENDAGNRRDEEQRKRSEADLQRVLLARQEMLAAISHDLRSPASAIKLSLELVRRAVHDPDGPIKPEQVERAIRKANSNVDRMIALVDDLLKMSQTETDTFDIEREDVDLREVIDEVVFDFEKAAESSGSSVEVRGAESVIGRWNWVRLQQVVSNLLSNAIKYGQGNPITVEIRSEDEAATLRVTDRGRGIPASQKERIFERYVRIDHRDHDQMEDSYGLGLWIVKQIVEALDGTIEVDSTPGEGATFEVHLPKRSPS